LEKKSNGGGEKKGGISVGKVSLLMGEDHLEKGKKSGQQKKKAKRKGPGERKKKHSLYGRAFDEKSTENEVEMKGKETGGGLAILEAFSGQQGKRFSYERGKTPVRSVRFQG